MSVQTIDPPVGDDPIIPPESGCSLLTYRHKIRIIDGTFLVAPSTFGEIEGSLTGPGDGTFVIVNRSPVATLFLCLVVNGKSISIEAFSSCNSPQFWNYRSTTGDFDDDANCSNATVIVDSTITQEEDPNNAVFFSDQSTPDTEPQGFTTNSNVTCPSSVTVNGLWIRGATQATNTFASFYHVQGTITDSDLRDNVGVINTGFVDKGNAAQGTHSAVISYNNAAGNSYQIAVRDSDGPESLGAVIVIPAGQCSIAPPPSATVNDHEFQIDISQAQCNGDQTSFVITMDDGPPDAMNVTIVNTMTGANVLVIETAEMRNINSHTYFFNRTLPPGTWLAYGFQDPPGITAPERFDAQAFNVPIGTCIDAAVIDLTNIISNLTFLNQTFQNFTQGANQTMTELGISLEIIVWVLMVAVTIVCAISNRLSVVIVSIPLGIVSILYGLSIFDSQGFEVGVIAVGAILAATTFGYQAEKQRERSEKERERIKHEEDYQE